MSTKTSTCSRRIRLNRLSLIEKTFIVDLLEEIPESLDITVIISYVRIIHIHPVTYTLCHVHPLGSVLHHLLAASVVIFLNCNLCSDILLRNAEHLLDAKLHWKTMSIPSCATIHLIAALSLVTADSILDRTCHDMVDARHTVS